MLRFVLILHVLAASVWAGGHLVLALSILPKALAANDPRAVHDFESAYERVGLPALLIQVITGVWLAHRIVPDPARWLSFDSSVTALVGLKLLSLGATLGLAIHARLRLVPRLEEGTLQSLAYHIVAVTSLAVFMVVLGVSFRFGGLT